MELREYFNIGLTVDAYTQLLNEDQRSLHELYERRAVVEEATVDAVRAAGTHSILVITEPWCGDSLAIFPVVSRLFAEAGCEIRIIRRDEHTDLIDQYPTNGGRAIPIVIVLDEDLNERFHWGPRPEQAQAIVTESRSRVDSGEIDKAEIHKQVRAFYATNHGKAIAEEITSALSHEG